MKLFAILMLSLGLVACAQQERIVTVEKSKYVAVQINEDLLKEFKLPKIIDRDTFKSLNEKDKRALLLDMIIDRDAIINQCNRRLFTINKESDELASLVEGRNTKGNPDAK